MRHLPRIQSSPLPLTPNYLTPRIFGLQVRNGNSGPTEEISPSDRA